LQAVLVQQREVVMAVAPAVGLVAHLLHLLLIEMEQLPQLNLYH
tara:strand:+ start:105 stop:236 length:132 start_codon:yes stop_codon:yes gene_type:complete